MTLKSSNDQAAGSSPHSLVSSHLRQIDGRDPEQDEVVKHAAGTMYAGKSIEVSVRP